VRAMVGRRPDDTTVRIDRRTSSTLDRLARETGVAKKEIIARAVEQIRRERILEKANAGFAAMKNNPGEWSEELRERRRWESTLSDGLTDE